ncbi:MAG: hypothetical protein LBJ11_06175 [Oscillospiraceae bacterium]|nr:hypothetical protein [Oscillospiraceae bacterium]
MKLSKNKREAALTLQYGCTGSCGEEIIFDHVGAGGGVCNDASGFFKGTYVSTT